MIAQSEYKGKIVYIGICRNCDHWHHNGGRCDEFFHEVRVLHCECKQWEPEDNLEYLELKATEHERSGISKRTSR